MAEITNKVLKTRIKLLYKTCADWKAVEDTFEPLKGEICLVNVPAESGAVVQEPVLLAKVGDGETKFKDLPWLSATSADVHAWAKKATLDWADLSDDFKESLASYVGAGNEYRLNKNGEIYTLETREYDATTKEWSEWKAVENSSIDISNKTDKKLVGANGTALIFNESDGGGAKFEHTDGTWSFVGVNDGGENGITGQIYTVKKNADGKYVGTRINMTKNGFFYTANRDSSAYTAADELATKGNISDAIASLGSALRYIGMTELEDGETLDEALARIVTAYQAEHEGYTLAEGAVAIVGTAEYIYDGSKWDEFGDEGIYATKAELTSAKEALETLITAEASTREANDNALKELIDNRTVQNLTGTNGLARIWNESDGGGVQFQNKDGTWSFVGVNDGGKDGITGQLYSVDKNNGNLGTRLNMTNEGFFYTNGKTSATDYTKKDELATKGDIENGLDDLADIADTGNVNDLIQTDGDYLILDCNI